MKQSRIAQDMEERGLYLVDRVNLAAFLPPDTYEPQVKLEIERVANQMRRLVQVGAQGNYTQTATPNDSPLSPYHTSLDAITERNKAILERLEDMLGQRNQTIEQSVRTAEDLVRAVYEASGFSRVTLVQSTGSDGKSIHSFRDVYASRPQQASLPGLMLKLI